MYLAACEGTLCCSTCHLIVAEEDFDSIPDPLTDEELDMLDTADNPTPTYVRSTTHQLVLHNSNT